MLSTTPSSLVIFSEKANKLFMIEIHSFWREENIEFYNWRLKTIDKRTTVLDNKIESWFKGFVMTT